MTSPDATLFDPPAFQPRRGLAATVTKYANILRASLVERMTYRVDFILGTLFRFLPILTTILLWRAIYSGASGGQGPNQSVLSGFTYREMIAYLLLTNISRIFSSMPGLAAGIARDVREGTIKRYLIQPVDMLGYLLSYRIAHKLAYIVGSSIPYAILFFLCRRYFDGFPDPLTFLGFLVSCILAFLVGFYFEVCVGLAGFWFLEVTSLLYIVMTLNFFISGHMLPLDLLPHPWSDILKALPFQYMAYYPAVVFQGKITGMHLVVGLLVETLWAVFFIGLARWLFNQGLKRYSAFGG
jgi:ABC-2 type transport system permease protein